MKNVLIIAISLLSLAGFAKSKDFRDTVKFQASTGAEAYAMAQAAVVEIKAARYNEKVPYLKNCNLRVNQYSDNFFFKRQAWTNTSYVYLNHVTGMYTSLVKVACTIRKKRD
jgi:hypothetical protein